MKQYVYEFRIEYGNGYEPDLIKTMSEEDCENALRDDYKNVYKYTIDEFFQLLNSGRLAVDDYFFKFVNHEDNQYELIREIILKMNGKKRVYLHGDNWEEQTQGDIDVYVGDGRTEEFVIEFIEVNKDLESFRIEGITWGDGEAIEFDSNELDIDNLNDILELL